MANLGKLAIAMLGVLAYQNRDKIGDLIREAGNRNPNDPQGGVLDQISKGVSGTALGDILDGFRGAGAGSKVDSWVGTGPNEPIQPSVVEAALMKARSLPFRCRRVFRARTSSAGSREICLRLSIR